MPVQDNRQLYNFLNNMAVKYNTLDFIENDPICIPHRFSKPADIEIAGLFAATLAWGQRTTIIAKCKQLMDMMDNSPHDFIRHHSTADTKALLAFKHRTFNADDLLYFIHFLQHHYRHHQSLEQAFVPPQFNGSIEHSLNYFYNHFFSLPHPNRTHKHIASPNKKSACKRLNMFLRWMVRQDTTGVDFGIWKQLNPSALICPIDVHVNKVARHFKLITRKQTDWQTAMELTTALRTFDAADPARFDFALFGYGIEHKGEF